MRVILLTAVPLLVCDHRSYYQIHVKFWKDCLEVMHAYPNRVLTASTDEWRFGQIEGQSGRLVEGIELH